MMLYLLFLASALPFTCAASHSFKPADQTLRLLHVLYRHGDRTPVRPYPKDPYLDVSNWPVSWGQLTNDGKDRHYRLGQFNRERYGEFLSRDYSPEEVYVRSTDVDRTLMSAECHLAGLFPPTDNQTWKSDLPWQPIPIHTIPKDDDLLLVLESKCPQYDVLVEQLNKSPEVRKRMESEAEMLNYLALHSGLNMTIMDDIEYLYDTLFIEARFNKTLPDWTSKYFPEKMKAMSDFSFEMKAYTEPMQRLRGGPWVREISDNMKAYAAQTLVPAARKLFMYSGHDVSVCTVLSALKVFNGIQPPYASMILVELHELKTGQFSVQVLYKNVSDDGEEPFPLTLPGCGEAFCPLDKFLAVTKSVVSDNLKAECGLAPSSDDNNGILVVYVLGASTALTFLALAVTCALFWRQRSASSGYAYTSIQET